MAMSTPGRALETDHNNGERAPATSNSGAVKRFWNVTIDGNSHSHLDDHIVNYFGHDRPNLIALTGIGSTAIIAVFGLCLVAIIHFGRQTTVLTAFQQHEVVPRKAHAFTVPHRRDPQFSARDEVLELMRVQEKENEHTRMALYGMVGVGCV